MRVVVQRVSSASVSVGGELMSSIGRGLCVMVGIRNTDTHADMIWMTNKLLKLRLFEDSGGRRWGEGVMGAGLELLCISQFTLYCELKGNKPDYRHAMSGDTAQQFYAQFLDKLRQDYHQDRIKDGVFGAMMEVSLVNDGPVTVTLDSPQQAPKASKKAPGSRDVPAVTENISNNTDSSDVTVENNAKPR